MERHPQPRRRYDLAVVGVPARQSFDNASTNRPSSSCWAGFILRLASSTPNHPARSTSGNIATFPLRGGQGIEKVLLFSSVGSQSPSAAQAWTVLPPFCFTAPSET